MTSVAPRHAQHPPLLHRLLSRRHLHRRLRYGQRGWKRRAITTITNDYDPDAVRPRLAVERVFLYRPTREWLIFHLQDDRGDGFVLDLTARDVNIYMQGPRPVWAWVVGPHDETLARQTLEDDGIIAGEEEL